MQSTKLYTQIDKDVALEYFNILNSAFEDVGFPVAMNELSDNPEKAEISVYIDKSEQFAATSIMQQIYAGICEEPLELHIETLPQIDWVQYSLEKLQPIETNLFFIHGSHKSSTERKDKIAVEIDANQAFGTGHHDTTLGCISMIEKVLFKRDIRKALDLGTGSGILSIVISKILALKGVDFDYKPVVACDIDPLSVQIASDNISKNKVEDYVSVLLSDGLAAEFVQENSPYDLIVANILSKPLIHLSPEIAKVCLAGADIILSGILLSQAMEVVNCYQSNGFSLIENKVASDWVTLHFTI